MTRKLNIVSICRVLPRPGDSSEGIFIFKRLAALGEMANVRIVQPVPYFPVLRPLPAWSRAASRTIERMTVHHAPMPYVPGVLKRLDAYWLARAVTPVLERLHAEQPVDLIDAHFGYPDGAGSVIAARRLAIPTFITLRGLEHDRIREAGVRRTLIDALRAATGCVAVSETLKSLAVDQGVDGARVAVIPNAIDGATFHCGDMAAARARLNLPANGGLIVSVGRLIAAKRHHELIDALAELRRRVPDATLAIIGGQSFEPHYPQQLRRQVHSLGLTEAVRFVGTIPQSAVADWLQAADAFALLSEREGCCNAVLEALATGLPVVATPVGDNAAFVRPTVNGDLVAVGDVGAATRALEHVIRRRDWDRRLISAELTAQVGSWQTVAGRVLQFFEQRLRAGMPSLSPASASA